MKNHLLFATALLTASTVGACNEEPSHTTDDSAFATRDSAGVELLVTRPEGNPPPSGWRIGPETNVVFGTEEAPPVEFFRINGMTRLTDGTVVVLDDGDNVLRFFHPNGELAATAGNEGDGPGEFQGPRGPLRTAADTILVFDARHLKFSLFGPDGTFLEDRRLEPPVSDETSLSQFSPAGIAGDTVLMIPTNWRIRMNDEPGRYVMEVPMLRYTTSGSYIGEMAEPSAIQLERRAGSVTMVMFTQPMRATAHDGHVYVVDPARYEIRVYPHDGGLERVYRLQAPRRPTTDADEEAYLEWLTRDAEDDAQRRRVLAFFEGTSRADSFPALDFVHVDAGGNLWVVEYRPAWEGDGGEDGDAGQTEDRGARHAILSAEGSWIGSAEVPGGFQPFEIGEDAAIGVQTDELGVQRAVEYPVHRTE